MTGAGDVGAGGSGREREEASGAPGPEGLLLALETSTSVGSVALGRVGDAVLGRRLLRRQGAHASALVPAVADLLDEAGVDRTELDGVVVGAGPGSFTGVRVAAATAKGLVRGLEVPLWAVSSLAAGAVTAGLEIPELEGGGLGPADAARPRTVLFDARGERVYAASYRVADGRLETLVAPRASDLESVLDGEEDGPGAPSPDALFCGSGAARHRERIEERGYEVFGPPAGIPTGDALLRILTLDPDIPPVESPGRWEPEYLRAWKSDRERRAG